MTIKAQGGFNTGRLYTAEGQQVYWWQDEEGFVTFYDRSRMIIGLINHPIQVPTPESVMRNYDNCNYSMAFQPGHIPKDFDFGPALKI